MQVIINGEQHLVTDQLSLAQAVELLTSSQAGVAAAVNGDVVRRAAWNSTRLTDGDEVEVLTAVQGG
jgi:sulfur carrier protein